LDDDDADELRVMSLDALRRAAARAATVGAPEVAERSYKTAAELATDPVERAELTQAAGEMALSAGSFETALELLEDAAGALQEAQQDRNVARITMSMSKAMV